jgi:hypothetical protein
MSKPGAYLKLDGNGAWWRDPQDYSGFGLKPQTPTAKSAQLASRGPARAAGNRKDVVDPRRGCFDQGSRCQIADDMSEWDFHRSGNAAQNRHPNAAGFDTDAAGRGFVFSGRPGDTNIAHSTMRARGCKLRKRPRGLLQNSDDRSAPIGRNVQSSGPDRGAVLGVCARACSAAPDY